MIYRRMPPSRVMRRPIANTCDSEDRYEAEITPEGIRVTCRRCGATALVPTGSMVSAHEFLTADSLRLE